MACQQNMKWYFSVAMVEVPLTSVIERLTVSLEQLEKGAVSRKVA